jgi:hypothetical protein
MKLNRRVFISLAVIPWQRGPSIPVEVLETFNDGGSTLALLVHHADPANRQQFSEWIHGHSPANIRIRTAAGQETPAKIFRMRMCFGRALILLNSAIQIGEHERLTVTLGDQIRVK